MKWELQGSGPPVLLLHGLPTSGRLWDYVVPLLRRRLTCVVVDLPGLGQSPPFADRSLDLERYAQELEALREELSLPRWHVVGHDAGSTIAVHYAARFRERVQRLVLCSPPILPEHKVPWFFRVLRAPIVGDCLAPLAVVLLWRLGFWLSTRRHDPGTAEIIQAFRHPFTGYHGMRHFVHLLRWGDPTDVLAKTAALLPRITAPTLILHGKSDRTIPSSLALRAGALIPNAAVHLIEGPHFLPLVCPETVCRYLLPFLEQGDPARIGHVA